jgi:hypothetical protein
MRRSRVEENNLRPPGRTDFRQVASVELSQGLSIRLGRLDFPPEGLAPTGIPTWNSVDLWITSHRRTLLAAVSASLGTAECDCLRTMFGSAGLLRKRLNVGHAVRVATFDRMGRTWSVAITQMSRGAPQQENVHMK